MGVFEVEHSQPQHFPPSFLHTTYLIGLASSNSRGEKTEWRGVSISNTFFFGADGQMCRNIKFMGKAAGRKGRRYYWNHPPHQRTHSTHLVGTTIQIQRVVCLLHTFSTASVQEFPFQCLNDSLTTFLQASKPVVSFVMYCSSTLPLFSLLVWISALQAHIFSYHALQ